MTHGSPLTPRHAALARQYYIDTCLTFGLHSAPSIFLNNLASGLHWVLENNCGATLPHHWYLDGLVLETKLPARSSCSRSMRDNGNSRCRREVGGTSHLCKISGHLSSLQQLRVPPDKLQEIASLTRSWLGRAAKRELLSSHWETLLCSQGSVPGGRLFLHRLIHLSTTLRRLQHHTSTFQPQ